MNDTWTVYCKEMREAFGDRHSMRGAMLQAAICIVLTGIIVPATQPSVLVSASSMLMLYVVFPATFAATLAADAFAGERERQTIETLFATPLDDRSIFFGKAATSVTFVVAVSALSLGAGILTSLVVRSGVTVTAEMILGTLMAAFSAAFLVAALAIAISVKVHVARAAQQTGSLSTFLLAGIAATVLKHTHQLTWNGVMGASVVAFLIGIAALLVLMMRFSRSDFFTEN